MMGKRVLICSTLLLTLTLVGCGHTRLKTADYFAMDTFIRLEAYGRNADEALADCQAEARRIEALLSTTLQASDIYAINHAAGSGVQVSPETAALLADALQFSMETEGAFEPSVYPLVKCWGFLDETQRIPEEAEIRKLLPLVDWRNIALTGRTVTLHDGAGVDLGGIAKGYAADRMANLLRERGVKNALLSLGGNIYALGRKPNGNDWRIGIQDPHDPDSITGVVRVRDAAVVTSGSYQRYFVQGDRAYHHILDPKTGWPAESGLASVTVICENAARADALSTALFVMGLDRATAYWRANGTFAAVFVGNDGAIFYTDNAGFEPSKPNARKIAK